MSGRTYHGIYRQRRTWHKVKGLSQDSFNFQCCSKGESIWDLCIHSLACLLCIRWAYIQGFKCLWRLVSRGHENNQYKTLLREQSPGGFWSVHQASEQSEGERRPNIPYLRHFGNEGGSLPDSHNFIWNFPSVRMQCEIDFQASSTGANLAMNIDSQVLKNCGKKDKSMNIAPAPVCLLKWEVPLLPSGARRRKKKKTKNPEPEILYFN